MFADWAWIGVGWVQGRLVVVELGPGKGIPTVRMRAERTAATVAADSGRRSRGSLMRINPDPAAAVPPGANIALPAGPPWRPSPRSARSLAFWRAGGTTG